MDLFDDDSGSECGENEVVNITGESVREKLLDKRPENSGVLAFHTGTEESMLLYVERNAEGGSAASVLETIDNFCYSRHWMMHIGDQKSSVLEKAVRDVVLKCSAQSRPVVCVELGSYCGYSAVVIGKELRDGDKLLMVEGDPKCSGWTNRLLAKVSLPCSLEMIQSTAEDSIEKIRSTLGGDSEEADGDRIDLLFIDHDKERYLQDLLLFEASGLLRSGCIVIADNVYSFGEPLSEYLDHVRDKGEGGLYESSELTKGTVEYSVSADGLKDGDYLEDGVEISVLR